MQDLQFTAETAFCIAIGCGGEKIGELRWALLWGELPFLEKIILKEDRRGEGIGTRAMHYFERTLAQNGYKTLLVSTREDESGQHFFRKLGYKDCGALDMRGFAEPQPAAELFLYKNL